jgi:hypothetical protein
MLYGEAVAQTGASTRPEPDARSLTAAPPAVKEIPYDYVARFVLTGVSSRRVQDVINISTEGAFVAVAVGYSFIPAPLGDLAVSVKLFTDGPLTIETIEVDGRDVTNDVLLGVPLHLLASLFPVPRPPPSATTAPNPQLALLLRSMVRGALVRRCGIDFRYSIVDSGSGRELQNQPIHNIAGLGEAGGNRPFRPLPKPALFMPRSTIRIEVEEVSEGPLYANAQLFLVLHGYKMLGYGTTVP